MFCIHCGKEIPEGSKFCNQCGKAQEVKAAPWRKWLQYLKNPVIAIAVGTVVLSFLMVVIALIVPGGSGSADSSGSSGSSGSYGTSYTTPVFARLDCLTCKGDGDCNTCGGDGYTGFGDAKAGCRSCHGNGKCTACGGSGKR